MVCPPLLVAGRVCGASDGSSSATVAAEHNNGSGGAESRTQLVSEGQLTSRRSHGLVRAAAVGARAPAAVYRLDPHVCDGGADPRGPGGSHFGGGTHTCPIPRARPQARAHTTHPEPVLALA